MENAEYNRLVYNNKLDELANIWNISDLVQYRYLNKYLLEYLLEKNIHPTRIDNYAINNKLCVNLYMKYNIIEPLINVPLKLLLEQENNIYLLDILLDKMNDHQKIVLYKNIKYTWVWLYRHMENEIINIFKNHGILIPKTFLELPKITDNTINISKILNNKIKNFKKVFKDIDKNILNIYIEELKRSSKTDLHRTLFDIDKLIEYKKDNPSFKLCINNLAIYNGSYVPGNDSIIIDKHIHGIFNHELSHMLFEQYEEIAKQEIYREYSHIRRAITKQKTIYKIVNYLDDFHKRVNYMRTIFNELYFKEIEKQYGSISNYCLAIHLDILNIKPEKMTIDDEITEVYIDCDDVEEAVKELMASECKDFINICTTNYYREELSLENLLDALLRGNINRGDYYIESYSGHTKEYFNEDKYLSLDECLADYDAIKHSKKADLIINKLIELVGEDLVNLLEEYLENERGSKRLKKYKDN